MRVRGCGRRRFGAAALCCGAWLGLVGDGVLGAPFVPADEGEILERLPRRDEPEWAAIAALHEQLALDPGAAAVLAPQLVDRYLDLFRRQGDPRLIAYAQRELARWGAVPDAPVAVALRRAELAQLTHRFDAARAELERLLARAPREPQAWLMLAAVDLVRGDYTASRRACTRLVLLQDATVAGACVAAAQSMTGEAAAAYTFLEGSLAADSLDPELAVWLETLAAETAEALGDGDAAARHYRAALAESDPAPGVYLVTAYADCLLRVGRASDAARLLHDAPPADPILLRLALAEKRLGRPDETILERLGYRLQLALQGNETAHAREAAFFALYLLEQPELALARALDNWTMQRETIDARLVLAAAAAAGRPAAAAPVVDWLEANGVEHVELEQLRAGLAP